MTGRAKVRENHREKNRSNEERMRVARQTIEGRRPVAFLYSSSLG